MTRAWSWPVVTNFRAAVTSRAIAFPVLLWVFMRAWTSFWAAVAALAIPPAAASRSQYWGVTPLSGSVNEVLWAPWQRFDTIWYTKIAEQGYALQDSSRGFFPLYPLLIKLAGSLTGGNLVAAAVLISSLLALVSMLLYYRLTADRSGNMAAERGLLLLLVFPTAFFLWTGYTESLFLSLVLGIWLAMRGRHWGWVGLLGALAGLARSPGMLLILPLAVEWYMQYRRREVTKGSALWLFVTLAGGLAFWTYLGVLFKNPFAGLSVLGSWRQAVMPWDAIGHAVITVLNPTNDLSRLAGIPDLLISFLFLGLLVLSFKRLPISWSIYMLIILLPPLSGITIDEFLPLAGMSRYALLLFPGFVLLGQLWRDTRWQRLLVGFSLLLQTLWLILFVAWVFVG